MAKSLVWTDDEVELLLKVTLEYKTAKKAENIDWESVQSKYGNILERYRELYPSVEEALATGKEYPHKKDEITKGQVTSKLKATRIKYRQAVDSGRKHVHGRVVFLFFDLCESIWGESSATNETSEGIETDEVAADDAEWAASSSDIESSSMSDGDEDGVSAKKVASRHQRRNTSCRKYSRGRTAMEKSKTRESFVWTDDEVELLLKVTREYKTAMAAENIDWESSQSKYGDILERYREQYPSPEEAVAMGKEYPHKKDEITKGQFTTKLKAIRIKFRQAVDSGRKRGHGRVVLLYFELCKSIWGGSPAVNAISEGIETSNVAAEAVESVASSPDTRSSSVPRWDMPVPGGDMPVPGGAEDALSAETVANGHQTRDASCRKYCGETTVMEKVKTRDLFVWTNDEVELLLKVTHEYKTAMAAENIDWESSHSKYSDILERYREQYPSLEEAIAMGKEFPHKKDEITKGQFTTKLKAIRIKYRQAVDSGRKRGHGRVVFIFFELCESIWGGSPAANAISEGIETAEDVELVASLPDPRSSSVPGGDGVAEDAMSAEMVANGHQTRDASCRKYYRETAVMEKTKSSFVWTDDEVELLLKVTHEYKTVMAAEKIDWEMSPTKYSDILELYWKQYPSSEEAMGKEFPHKKDEITKGQLTTKLKAIRVKYRQAVSSGRKHGHGRVVLFYFDLCESIWGGSPATNAISEGIETGDVAAEAVESTASSPDARSPSTRSSSVPGGDGDADDTELAGPAAYRRDYRSRKLKRKHSADSVAQEELDIKRRLLQRLEATDEKFAQTTCRWSSTMSRLNSNIELLVKHIVGSGAARYMTSLSSHATQQSADSYGHKLTGRPLPECSSPPLDVELSAEGLTLPSPPDSVEGEKPTTSTEPTLSELMEEFGLEAAATAKSSEREGGVD